MLCTRIRMHRSHNRQVQLLPISSHVYMYDSTQLKGTSGRFFTCDTMSDTYPGQWGFFGLACSIRVGFIYSIATASIFFND